MVLGVAPTPSRSLLLGTGHSGSSLRGTTEGGTEWGPCAPPGLSASALSTQSGPLEAPQWVVLGVAPYTLQVFHPRSEETV